MEPPSCKNIRSKRHPDQRCANPAVHGTYCGLHFKHPTPYKSRAKLSMDETDVNEITIPMDTSEQVKTIQRWWRFYGRLRLFFRQGPAKWLRTLPVNSTDFYSMEEITTISGEHFFSLVENDKTVYAFDIRSLVTLLEKNINPENPYNRQPFSESNLNKAKKFIRWSRIKGVDTRWVPIIPESPDQRFKLKVTDLFQKIDELNYYTNPDWFIKLSVDNLRCFYVELYDIWVHRAELSADMKKIIIPPPAHPFKYPIREVVALKSLDSLRKINLDIIRMFISAAVDKSDRTLGAMYVVTALTLVNTQCKETYPWLYESATPGIYSRYRVFNNAGEEHAHNAINTLFGNNIIFADIPNFFLNQLLLTGTQQNPDAPN